MTRQEAHEWLISKGFSQYAEDRYESADRTLAVYLDGDECYASGGRSQSDPYQESPEKALWNLHLKMSARVLHLTERAEELAELLRGE